MGTVGRVGNASIVGTGGDVDMMGTRDDIGGILAIPQLGTGGDVDMMGTLKDDLLDIQISKCWERVEMQI